MPFRSFVHPTLPVLYRYSTGPGWDRGFTGFYGTVGTEHDSFTGTWVYMVERKEPARTVKDYLLPNQPKEKKKKKKTIPIPIVLPKEKKSSERNPLYAHPPIASPPLPPSLPAPFPPLRRPLLPPPQPLKNRILPTVCPAAIVALHLAIGQPSLLGVVRARPRVRRCYLIEEEGVNLVIFISYKKKKGERGRGRYAGIVSVVPVAAVLVLLLLAVGLVLLLRIRRERVDF